MPVPVDLSLPSDAELQAKLLEESHREELAEGVPADSTTPTEPLVLPAEPPSDATLQPGTRVGAYEIVEFVEERAGQPVYRAQAPADRCTQCGTQAVDPDARFCEECGAELLPRDVLLVQQDDRGPKTGPALLVGLPDDPLRAVLPPLDILKADGREYLVLEGTVPGYQSLAELLSTRGDAPQEPAALDESDALPIATQLAKLLEFLHEHSVALGDLSLAQLLIGPQRRLRLRDIADIQPLTEQSRQADLRQLVATIEDLTRTPRETRKLSVDTLDSEAQPAQSLEDVLALGRTGQLRDASAWVKVLEGITTAKQAIRGLTTRLGSRTDVGVQREIDEDALMTQELRIAIAGVYVNAGIYVVADGMGGHAAGEIASTLAVQAAANSIAQQLVELASASGEVTDERLGTLVKTAVEAANLAVYNESRRRQNDMGTTMTLALVVGDRCIIGNVGDSRTYLVRGGKLERVTTDHSLVMRLVDLGQITEDEIYSHPHRSAILRSLGEKPNVETDLFPLRLVPGDMLFLCSDGQWEMVRNPRMQEMIVTIDDPQEAADQLVDEANKNGGEDNITTVLVRFG
jgi:protein phosphatase